MHTRLCVTITGPTAEDAVSAMRSLPPEVSVVEMRFDLMQDPDVERICRARDREIIATCRSETQGGRFRGDPSKRLAILRRAAAAGAEYIDLEFEARDAAGELRRPAGCRLILSEHDFSATPTDLPALHARIAAAGADIVKIATQATTILDAVRMLQLVRGAARPTIGLCMGEAGAITRILAPKVGAFLSYASLVKGAEAAPGQIPWREMLALYRFARVGPDTAVYGVIANPVGHSMSPAVHNAAFQSEELNAVYVPLLVDDVVSFVPAFSSFDVGGYSVTIPHKEAMVGLMDEVEPLVRRIGALNTVVVRGGRLLGCNTDVKAALDAIAAACGRAGWGPSDRVLAGKRVLLIGAGGAARALAHGLAHAGALLQIANRTVSRAEALAAELRADSIALDALSPRIAYDVLVNTTSVGMSPRTDATPVQRAVLRRGTVVFDAVYNPLETRLLREAAEAGCIVASGFDWFVGQAAAQFELWTGHRAPAAIMADVVRNRLGAGAR